LKARIVILSALLTVDCCPSSSATTWPDPKGLQAQRTLIEQNFAGADVRADARAAANFREGHQNSVSAAWWGFDENDATHSLQASLDSGAKVVLIPAMGRPWVTTTLFPRSHTTIVLQEGAEVLAKKGAFHGGGDALICMKDVEDVEMSSTWGTLPCAGIDFEPNNPDERLVACRLRNCNIRHNAGAGIQVYLKTLNAASLPIDIQVEDCFVSNLPCALMVFGIDQARGKIDFLNTQLLGLKLIGPGSGLKVTRN
jgi:hypothetical protein